MWTKFSEQWLGNSIVGRHVLHAKTKFVSAAHSEAPAIWISALLFTMMIRYLHKTHHPFSSPWRVMLIRKAWSQAVTAEVTAPRQTAPDSPAFNWWVYTGSADFCPYHLTCFSFSQSYLLTGVCVVNIVTQFIWSLAFLTTDICKKDSNYCKYGWKT